MGFKVISVQATPNPNAKKFVLDRTVSAETQSYLSADAAKGSDLATKLFALSGVDSVLFLNDFITVNKQPEADWKSLTPNIKSLLKSFAG